MAGATIVAPAISIDTDRGDKTTETTTMAIDPVCGMTVDPATARRTTEYQGMTFYFCSPSCRQAFDADPAGYVGEAESGSAPEKAGGCACCAVQA